MGTAQPSDKFTREQVDAAIERKDYRWLLFEKTEKGNTPIDCCDSDQLKQLALDTGANPFLMEYIEKELQQGVKSSLNSLKKALKMQGIEIVPQGVNNGI